MDNVFSFFMSALRYRVARRLAVVAHYIGVAAGLAIRRSPTATGDQKRMCATFERNTADPSDI
jgi:hypothetical protein